jgi:amino acid adenylation domain-containing protein/thioester reductase-like protein
LQRTCKKGGQMSSVTERIANSSLESLRKLARKKNNKDTSAQQIQPRSRDTNRFPLSFGQERLWFLDRLFPGSSAYNIPFALHFSIPTGETFAPSLQDVISLQRCVIDELVKRHEIWRTSFTLHNGAPVQLIHPAESVPLEIILLSDVPEHEKTKAAAQIILDRVSKPFDLSGPSQCRFGMIQLSATEYIAFIICHHIVFDGWSSRVAVEEFRLALLSALSGHQLRPTELPIQYADYAAWQREWWRNDEVREGLSRFWTERLKDLPVLNLPTDHPRRAIQSFRGRTESFFVAGEQSDALRQLSKNQGVTLFATLLAAWAVLLQRYTGGIDIPICVPVSNRTRVETEALIGFFVNTLVLRLDLSGDPTFSEFQKRIWKTCTESYAHQEMPFEQLVQLLQPTRDLSRNPLSSISFQLQDIPTKGTGAGPSEFGGGMSFQPFEVGAEASAFDLDFSLSGQWDAQWVDRASNEIRGKLTYGADLFEESTVRKILQHYQKLLRSVIDSPDLRISELTMMDEAERQQLLVEWNCAPWQAAEGLVHELFEKQVENTPDAVALEYKDEQLSYGVLNGRANQLARYLRQIGVGPESRVALCLERNCEMVVALLAVLKAGGAYVPLDPAYPVDRLRFMIEDSTPLVLLTHSHLQTLFTGISNGMLVLDPAALTTSCEQYAACNLDREAVQLSPENLSYLIYTSGSTGVPKGVQITHAAVVNFLTSMRQEPGLSREDVLLAVTTLSFDIAGLELYLPLAVGARVVLASREDASDAAALAQSIVRYGITVMQATPATWHLLTAAAWEGRKEMRIFCGGDTLPRSLANGLLERSACLWNLFGPTETTIWSMAHRVSHASGPVPIGRPIVNTSLYILDEALEPVAIGVPAELYIGGAGLARGYRGRPDLTAERFIPDPFATQPGARLYRTGDRVRYLADANIEFLGRNDFQVKIRGFRIELAEIEKVLLQHPAIEQAAVLVWDRGQDDKRLVAYIQKNHTLDQSMLRGFLRQHLPEYMVPGTFVDIEQMPTNSNGKLDRKRLPLPATLPLSDGQRRSSHRTPIQQLLLEMWSRMLNVSDIGIDDSFFDLGGHSLLALRLLDETQQTFQIQLPLRTLFARPTIAGLAEKIELVLAGNTEEGSETPPDFDSDSTLDPTIVPNLTARVALPFSTVLLTGATGFVGSFLLSELLHRTQANVYCLVRASSSREGFLRLKHQMEQLNLWQPQMEGKITIVCGDLSLDRLGLSKPDYDELAETSDAIYHAGASVSFFYPYRMLKAVNVLGTEVILRLACHKKQKPVHYVSTMGVFPQASLFTPAGDYEWIMKEEDVPSWHGLEMGYSQSKWVAERLVAAATSRGVPAAIYRPTIVYGHGDTGEANSQDFLYRFIYSCGQLGCAPDIDWDLNLVPVDFVARGIVELSLDSASIGQVFHLVNEQPASMIDVVDCIVSSGFPIKKILYGDWRTLLLATPDNALAALARGFPEENPHVLGDGRAYPDRQFRCDRALNLLRLKGHSCPDVRGERLQKYVSGILSEVSPSPTKPATQYANAQ